MYNEQLIVAEIAKGIIAKMPTFDIEVDTGSADRLRKELGALLNANTMRRMNRELGINVRERTADHIAQASVSRHKTADRLGAPHSKLLEFAPARGMLRGGSKFKGQGEKPYTEVADIKENEVSVVIGNTPGLRRAFGSITVRPQKAKALTIPLHKVSYGKRVADLKNAGIKIFRPSKSNILADMQGKGKRAKLRPLYALVKKTVLSQDSGLLPTQNDIRQWSLDSAEQFVETLCEEVGT